MYDKKCHEYTINVNIFHYPATFHIMKVNEKKIKKTNRHPSQKSIKRNSNSKQSNTDLQIDRG